MMKPTKGQSTKPRGSSALSDEPYPINLASIQPVEEAAVIEPLLRGLRDAMWRKQPALGLWYSMVFRLSADGRILPSFDDETRPTFAEQPADLAEARADLIRAPRPARWVPAWLANE